MLQIFLSFISSFSYTYVAAFYGKMEPIEEDLFNTLDLIFECIFSLEIFLKFFVEYRNVKTNEISGDPKHIFIEYIKGAFIIDLI